MKGRIVGVCALLLLLASAVAASENSTEAENTTEATTNSTVAVTNEEDTPMMPESIGEDSNYTSTSQTPTTTDGAETTDSVTDGAETTEGSGNFFTTDEGSGISPTPEANITTPTVTTANVTPAPETSPSSPTPMTSKPTSPIPDSPTTTGADLTSTASSTSSITSSVTSSIPSSDSNTEVIVGVAVGAAGVILLAIVILILVICCLVNYGGFGRGSVSGRKKLLEIALEELGTAGPNGLLTLNSAQLFAHIESDQLVRVKPSDLPAHVKMLHEEDGYAAEEEYDGVKELDPSAATSYASQSFNESRNRYINILPNDHTRVVLTQQGKVAGSDYINANFVDGYSSSREYIASQGPLPATVPDFWRMIWEQDTRVIVMVTNPVESQVVKCEEYWPSKGTLQCGGVKITLEGEQLFPEFVVRHFNISKVPAKGKTVSSKHSVTQFHFTSWPDFGVPQEASAMLKFVHHVRRSVCVDHGPMVVHCSAGVGRTGTFIAIDILLQRMQEPDCLINVQEVVARMRAQRGLMVQTNAQYLFIYDALLHAHIHGTTEVKSSELREHADSLTTPTTGDSESVKCCLDKEFGHVMSVELPEDHSFESANHPANQPKNRNQDSVPMDMNRVVLEELEGKEDSDYINASYIDGYYNRVEFVTTQHPLPHTVKDFWRMVMERSINTLVIFGPLKESKDRYWPVGEEVMEFDNGVSVHRVTTQEEEGEREGGEEGMGEEVGERLVPANKPEQESTGSVKVLETQGGDEEVKQGEGKEGEEERGGGEKKVGAAAGESKSTGELKAEGGDGEEKKEDLGAAVGAGVGAKSDAGQVEGEGKEVGAEKAASEESKTVEEATQDVKSKETENDKKEVVKEEAKTEEETVKESVGKEKSGAIGEPGATDKEKCGANGGEDEKGTSGEKGGASGDEKGQVTQSSSDKVFVRRFVVEMDDARTHVNMYHLVGWTTEGAPNQTTPILNLIESSRTHWRSTGFNPIVIHTATGVKDEASGVYCGLCILLRQLEVEDAVDVVCTMERIRQQRPAVLTSKDYYSYLYTVLLAAL